jgi:predicted mannosyl-3-phosphoglycerate phosphatase (HAD superfamily)
VTAVDGAAVRAARKEMARVERQLQKLAQREEQLHAQMVEKSTDLAAVTTLDAELRALAAEREQLEETWLEASELTG